MYCPLCKAEYREGFALCSDCRIDLVSTRAEAEAAKVMLLWQGTSSSRFDGMTAALHGAQIPHLARSGATVERPFSIWANLPIIGPFVRMKETYDEMSWRIFVLERDSAAARMALRSLE